MARQSGHDDLKPGLDNPGADAIAVTPDDNTDLVPSARGLYVGGTGNVAVMTIAGTSITFVAVPAGSILPVRCKRVLATGTSGSMNIVALV